MLSNLTVFYLQKMGAGDAENVLPKGKQTRGEKKARKVNF